MQPKAAEMVIIGAGRRLRLRCQAVGRQYIPPPGCRASSAFVGGQNAARGGDERPILIQPGKRPQRAAAGGGRSQPAVGSPERADAERAGESAELRRESVRPRASVAPAGAAVSGRPLAAPFAARRQPSLRHRDDDAGERPLQAFAGARRKNRVAKRLDRWRAAACSRRRRPPSGCARAPAARPPPGTSASAAAGPLTTPNGSAAKCAFRNSPA